MERFSQEKTKEVWQRVLREGQGSPISGGVPAPKPENVGLLPLVVATRQAAAGLQNLQRRAGSASAETLRRLAAQTQRQAECLLGIYRLLNGGRPAAMPSQNRAQFPLEELCTMTLRRHAALQNAESIPEYGPVFALLAEETAGHGRTLLELLGR